MAATPRTAVRLAGDGPSGVGQAEEKSENFGVESSKGWWGCDVTAAGRLGVEHRGGGQSATGVGFCGLPLGVSRTLLVPLRVSRRVLDFSGDRAERPSAGAWVRDREVPVRFPVALNGRGLALLRVSFWRYAYDIRSASLTGRLAPLRKKTAAWDSRTSLDDRPTSHCLPKLRNIYICRGRRY